MRLISLTKFNGNSRHGAVRSAPALLGLRRRNAPRITGLIAMGAYAEIARISLVNRQPLALIRPMSQTTRLYHRFTRVESKSAPKTPLLQIPQERNPIKALISSIRLNRGMHQLKSHTTATVQLCVELSIYPSRDTPPLTNIVRFTG